MATMTKSIFEDLERVWKTARRIDSTGRGMTTDLCRPRSFGFNAERNQAAIQIQQMLTDARELVARLEPMSQLELIPFEELPE